MINRRDLLAYAALLAGAFPSAAANSGPLTQDAVKRSQVSLGDPARFRRVFERAARGETIRLGFIGGSITAGAMATTEANSYVTLVVDWWRRCFPRARFEIVNAAVGGTGSLYGSLRIGRQLLSRDIDAMIIEFAVNDAWTDQEPFESLVRHVLASSPDIAAMLLFMFYDSGGNEQEWQEEIGAHYGLPMVSARNALWPDLQNGGLRREDFFVDIVHPNDLGHRITAELVTAELAKLRTASPGAQAGKLLPSPLYGARFANAEWLAAPQLHPNNPKDWSLGRTDDPPPHALGPEIWLSEPGNQAPLSLDWRGTGLVAVMKLENQDPNPVTLMIDGQVAEIITAETQPRRNIVTVALDLPRGKHGFSVTRTLGNGARPFFGLYGIGIIP